MIVPKVRNGAIRFGIPVTIVREEAAFAIVDGGHGPGEVVATKAMDIAIRKAQQSTVASVWVRNANDFTRAANYSEMALAYDRIGLAMSNSTPHVAAWGGREPIFGTSPLSFAIPAGEEQPIVFDGSMSAVSHGIAVLAARDKAPLPGNWLVDEAGSTTDDPLPLVMDPYNLGSRERGALLPQGPKGFGWLIWVDVFAGILSGMSSASDIPIDADATNPDTRGIYLSAIDVGKLLPIGEFKAKVDNLIRTVKASRLAEEFTEIVLPGERSARGLDRGERKGLPFRDEDWDGIESVAVELGVDVGTLRTSFTDKAI